MHKNDSNEICFTPLGLTVIVFVLAIVIIILLWGYTYYRLVGNPFTMSEFMDIHAPVWQGGYDCPPMQNLQVLPATTITNSPKPCTVITPVLATPTTTLTDTQFLEYMIAHHQVAVTMAKSGLKSSRNQYILELARKMVWQQGYEITMMHAMLGRLPQPFSKLVVLGHYNTSLLSFYKGLASEPVKCYDDMFTDGVADHLPQITDRQFLTHMIAHHELGLAMSRAQLNRGGTQTSQSGFMLALLYDIIHDQEQELDRMRSLASSTLWENSKVLGY
jgi:uncharacterized protein (DUF305 family)